MSSHGSQSTAPLDKARVSSQSSGQDDFKRLLTKYKTQLATLKELFSDWSDEDLLFAIQDADGDVVLAIDRISEGHVCQWGEVKSRKSKKDPAQKAKAAAATSVPSVSHSSTQPNRTERPLPPKTGGDTAKRAPAGRSTRVSKPVTESTSSSSWGNSTRSVHRQEAGSWASIASIPKTVDDSAWGSAITETRGNWASAASAGGNDWGSTTKSNVASSEWGTESTRDDEAKTVSQPPATSSGPKTWASLLKSTPKPEPKSETTQQPTSNNVKAQHETTAKQAPKAVDGWDAPVNLAETSSDEWNAPSKPVNAWGSSVEEESQQPPAEETKPAAVSEAANTALENEKEKDGWEEDVVPERKASAPIRQLVQDDPVVLPNNSTTVESVQVQFGGLNLEEGAAAKKDDTASVSHTSREPASTAAESQPTAAAPVAQQESFLSDPFSHIKQPEPQQPQSHAQIGQPQPHFAAEHFGYGAYGYQLPTGIYGHGMNPMGLPDYGYYDVDAQRAAAAAAMGYYDPATFNASSPAAAAGAYRDKNSQESISPMHSQHNPQASGLSQHMYQNNMQYYQYYYMQNQFPGYQHSAGYNQPYQNKGIHPGMYQPATGKTPTTSTTSSYGASATAYAQQMYNPSPLGGSGYDDVAGLQHHLGLHDYQKQYSSPQHLSSFLGSGMQGAGQQPQATNPSADTQGNKSDASQLGKSIPSASGANAQQQQNYQQHTLNQTNYFGHSLPFQQLHPQHFPQYPNASDQSHSHQSATGQQSPMGQQPYWSQ